MLPKPTRERRALVDSSAYLALLDQDDEHHARASSILTRLAERRYRLYTTNTMLIEAHALILLVLGRSLAARFLQDLEAGTTTVIRVRARDEQRAKQIIVHYADKDFSYNDAISFAVMERLNIGVAFTFDSDFAQYGWTILAPETF